MVKFSKQFEAQLVPEWKGAFVDYRQLKKDVKKIQVLRQKALATDHADTHRSLFGLDNLSHVLGFLKRKATLLINGDTEPSIIQVHRRLSGSDSAGDVYETEVLGDESEQTDGTKTFFNTLDDQLNKVNKFYVVKEKEFLERAETLKKQMLVLIELKAALKRQRQESSSHGGSRSGRNSLQSTDSADVSAHGSEEGDQAGQKEQLDVIAAFENHGVTFVGSPKRRFMNGTKTGNDVNGKSLIKAKSFHGRSFNAQGRNMRMDIPITTPSRTIAAITNVLWDDLINQSNKGNVNRKALRHAEKMIRGAFVELYRGLGFLKTYRSLNMLAFVKILKKFDKVTGQQTLPIYLKVVESSYFNSSDKVVKLSDEVEELFTKQFTDDDRGKAMKYLKPKQSKDSHTVTFFIGLFTGCFMALLIGYIIMAHIAGMYTDHRESGYMETVYPVFSMLCLLNLHILLYGCNILLWRNQRINYSFIFEFAHNTELKYQDVFLICSSYMTVVVGAMVAHLAFLAKGFSPVDVNTIPGFLLLGSLALLICPFNILYRSTRFSFLGVMRNIILSPLYKVVMVDFFMADQLTSQVSLLRQLEYITCYYVTGSFKNQDYDTCNNKQYRDLVYVVSFLPYYWRAMQCARRWFDEGDINHITNLGKYVSAMLAGGARLTYEKQQTVCWCILVVITSTIATIYQLYWDFVKDWGLLQPRSCNPWLRDELILKHKIIYFMSMALNVILRLAWLQTIIHLSFESVDYRVTGFFIASLEVIRRGHWNFYRLENEHLNNAGKFRALKIVPLPFHEVDDD